MVKFEVNASKFDSLFLHTPVCLAENVFGWADDTRDPAAMKTGLDGCRLSAVTIMPQTQFQEPRWDKVAFPRRDEWAYPSCENDYRHGGCKDPCRSQSATWDELLPAWNNPEGKAQSWEATWAHIRAPGNSGKVCINVNTFYLFITNSLFGRGDGNPPRQSNYIIEDWENLWVPLLISTVSWTVRPTITRSGESAARHKQLTDMTVLYKYKRQHLSPRRLHAANAHASIAAESFSQEASDLLS